MKWNQIERFDGMEFNRCKRASGHNPQQSTNEASHSINQTIPILFIDLINFICFISLDLLRKRLKELL